MVSIVKSVLIILMAVGMPSIVIAKCNFANSRLVSESGEEYPILSIRDCFGLESKSDMANVSEGCSTYHDAQRLVKRHKSAFVTGTSIVEVLYLSLIHI